MKQGSWINLFCICHNISFLVILSIFMILNANVCYAKICMLAFKYMNSKFISVNWTTTLSSTLMCLHTWPRYLIRIFTLTCPKQNFVPKTCSTHFPFLYIKPLPNYQIPDTDVVLTLPFLLYHHPLIHFISNFYWFHFQNITLNYPLFSMFINTTFTQAPWFLASFTAAS